MKNTKKALLLSVMSLLLCVSMLVGTTFAWFTDSVSTGNNIIASGNLDLEVTNEEGSIQDQEKLFDHIEWWEPGVVAYENLTVANVGTLALKYHLSISFTDENTVNGYGLSDVLKVAIVDEAVTEDTNRDALVNSITDWTLLSGLNEVGNLLPEEKEEFAIVIWWEPSAEDDNWNVNNGKTTSDGEPLHISLGVNVFATQETYEEDSFDNRYDGEAFVPVAQVTNLGAQTVDIFGADPLALDASFSFRTTEDDIAAAASGYRYWHADFVVSADSTVKAKSLALAGYYAAYCDLVTDGAWVMLTSDTDIAANTEIRLLELMGVSGGYEELCAWIPEFLCGVKDLDGSNEGTTLTVELRLYETSKYAGATSGTANEETGEYITIGVYTHTFGGEYVTLDDNTVLFNKNNGDVVLYDTQNVDAVDYTVPEGVTHLGNFAFAYTDTIKTVTLASTVTDLGRGFDSNTTIEKVVLNEGLETISSRAFKATTALEEVVIPSTVTVIEDNAFQKSGIKNIVIPATVETVGEAAFGASMVETVTFEGNTSIQGFAFRGCTQLRTVYLEGDDVTFIASTLNGRNSMWFCNGESNNANTSNITFYVVNDVVASRVKTAMGAEADNTPVIINGQEASVITVATAAKLQEALNNAEDGDIISFGANITGNVTVTQKADVSISIIGNDKTYTGVMTVFGNGRQAGAEALTIKNINFVAADGAASCIVSPDRTANNSYSYSHNVTVEGCTFTDPDGAVNCAAIRQEDGGDKNWTVRNCTVDSTMHSIFQINNVAGKLKVEGCKVYSKNGANLNCCTNVEIVGCEFDVKGYAVRFGVGSGGNLGEAKTFVIKDSTLKSACDDGDAVIMFRASAVDANLTLTDTDIIGTTEISGNTGSTIITKN